MGRTPVRSNGRRLSSSSNNENSESKHSTLKRRVQRESNKRRKGTGQQQVVGEPVDTADEGDEEFVQTSSEDELDEDEGEELDFSSETNELTEQRAPRTRRTSMRVTSAGTLSLRHRLRDRDPPNTTDLPARGMQRQRQRRATQIGVRDASKLFDGASVDPKGYASSPTTSAVAARRLRRGRADNVHGHSGLRNQVPESPNDSSDDVLTLSIDTPTRKKGASAATAEPLVHKDKVSGRKRLAPALIASIGDSGIEAATSSPQSRSQSRQRVVQEIPVSPPPIIDKPREERSYKEFFPDLNIFTPMVVRFHNSAVDSPSSTTLSPGMEETNPPLSAASSAPLTSLSSLPLSSMPPLLGNSDGKTNGQTGELPQASRSSSGLSIKLVFNDPGASDERQHTSSLPVYLGIEGPRSGGLGKSTASYAGTPQSAVVVLAPKKPVLTLPEARFRQISDKEEARQQQKREFKRPEGHYIRNVELTEQDLAERTEYDLDDADQLWLRKLNAGRTAEKGSAEVTGNMLEMMLDHMEKEWFELVKEAQRAISAIHQEQLPEEASACAICDENEGEIANDIVFCDGCDLAVHQDCYGVPYIPEGPWLCRSCMLSPDKDVTCLLCPQRGSAFKKTTTNKWVHLLCALWIPEVEITNIAYMEPIDGVARIPRSRWKLDCYLCRRKAGASIQCAHRKCCTAFHVTCARRAHLPMFAKPDRRTGDLNMRAFCDRHAPLTYTQAIDLEAPLRFLAPARRKRTTAALSLMSSDLVSMLHGDPAMAGTTRRWPVTSVELLSKAPEDVAALYATAADDSGISEDASLQLTMRIFNPDRPVLNEYVFERVAQAVPPGRVGATQRLLVAEQVARYWALKRSHRHGAPLLKRLHLEPWTAAVTQQRAMEMEEEQRQVFVRRIRTDLERVRLLAESVRRREREKLKAARALVAYLRAYVDPVTPILLAIVDELIDKRDPRGVLSYPITRDDASDYFDVIEEPMDFCTVRENIREYRYRSLDEVERHLLLVVANCMVYNKPTTYYYQLAVRVKRHVERLVADAREKIRAMPIDPQSGCLMVGFDMTVFDVDGRVPQALDSSSESITEAVAKASIAEPEAGVLETSGAVTRSSRQTSQPTTTAAPSADGKQGDGGMKTRSRNPAESTPKSSKSRAVPSSEPRRKPTSTRSSRSSRRKTHGPLMAGGRKLTLFEQLSVPPPDVRQQQRDRHAFFHPDEEPLDNDIPDDFNVLETRLRSSTVTPAKRKQREEEDADHKGAGKRSAGMLYSPGKALPTAAALGEDPASYAYGTPVWAKMPSFPWFPAAICDPKTPGIPDAVHGDRRSPECSTLVWFYSSNPQHPSRSWKWVEPAHVCKLGTDQALDNKFFRAKTKSSSMARGVRNAYAEACRDTNIEPLVALPDK